MFGKEDGRKIVLNIWIWRMKREDMKKNHVQVFKIMEPNDCRE